MPRRVVSVLCLALALGGCGSAPVAVTDSDPQQSQSGTAALTWTPVTQNTDGTTLLDLAGYKVRYGTAPDALDTIVVLDDPAQTSLQVSGLSSGTWYFAVAAYTSGGLDGELSNIAAKTFVSTP